MRSVTRRSTRTPKRRQRSVARRRLLGLAVVVIAPAIVVIGWQRPWIIGGSYPATVHAMFTSAHGISKVGNDVRMAGADVGHIDGVDRVGDHALITMKIQRAAARRLRADASASLRPRFAFEGTAFIDLNPGSASARPLAGATIPLSRTQTYEPLDQALKFLAPDVRTYSRKTVRDLADSLGGSSTSSLQRVFRQAPAVSKRLALGMGAAAGAHHNELAGTVRGASATLAAVAHQEASLDGFMRGTEKTFAALDTSGGQSISRTLQTVPAAMQALHRGGDALTATLDQLDPLSTDLRPGLRGLTTGLKAATPLLSAAPAALRGATPLVSNLRTAVSAGATATPAASSLLRSLQPTSAVLRNSLLPALNALTPGLHIPAYEAVLNLLEGGAGAFAPYQTPAQGTWPPEVGSGHFVRFDGHFYTGVGVPLPPCTLVDRVNPTLATALASGGVCLR